MKGRVVAIHTFNAFHALQFQTRESTTRTLACNVTGSCVRSLP